MRTGHYTRLKGRVTYFRRKVPEFLQQRLASREICYRLGVISSAMAERLGRKLAVEVDDFFERAKTDLMLSHAELSRLVNTALASWRESDALEDAEGIRTRGRPFLSPKEQATNWGELAVGLIEQAGRGQGGFEPDFLADMMRKAGLAKAEDQMAIDASARALTLGLAAHYLQSAVTMANMHGLGEGRKGLPVAAWQGRLSALEAHLDLSGSRSTVQSATPMPVENIMPAHTPAPPPGKAPPAEPTPLEESAMPFSKLVDLCLDTRIATGEIKPESKAEMTSSLRIWLETVGDRPIRSYKRADFLTFRSVLQKIPKIYWKSSASRELTILEVIEWARADARAAWAKSAPSETRTDAAAADRAAGSYEKVSNVTVNRHLSTISPVFEWASKNDHLLEDTRPFWAGLHVVTGIKATGLKPNEERPAYTHEQIQQIARHPVWLGRKSAYFYNAPGKTIIRDGLYWGFPIAYLHGVRREEFAQLKVKHVRQEAGIWVFDLRALDVSVKKGASRRHVPLHSKLLELGFLEAMVEGRAPEDLLFEELSAPGELDKFGDELGKRFARVLDHSGIEVIRENGTESNGCYHPLRHRFISDLLRAGVREGLVDSLSGQASDARKGERIRYDEDPSVGELKDAIEKLPIVVDFEPWIEAWKRLGSR